MDRRVPARRRQPGADVRAGTRARRSRRPRRRRGNRARVPPRRADRVAWRSRSSAVARGGSEPRCSRPARSSSSTETNRCAWTASAAPSRETSTPGAPSRARPKSPESTARAASSPAVKSAIAIPPARLGTRSEPCALESSRPDRAWATRSNAVNPASGPSLPSAETQHQTAAGLMSRTLSRSSSNRRARSGVRLWRTTSAVRISARLSRRPSVSLRSSTTERLLRFRA